ncbi:MAG: aminoglycoside phosphotransferase family protein [Clostridia bacterium]|nr:aminoglycoside phosphotransferase family protein [Clostridia bacterium]
MEQALRSVLSHFAMEGQVVSCEPHGEGHINQTYLVRTDCGKRYILQQMNHHIFKNIDGLMDNIQAVTAFLAQRAEDPRTVMGLIQTVDDKAYLRQEDGTCWRMILFVEDAICLQRPESTKDFYECAVAFGNFAHLLNDFPADTLFEVIPNFHNTADRYRIFREALDADRVNRAKDVQKEIAFILDREGEASTLVDLLAAGKLPLRVTHNDTKINNVMLDAKTRTALCVVDLDTVMPGLSLYDYGDAVRCGASTGAEDEKDLSKVSLDLDMFESFTKGYLAACPDLTDLERELMPLGIKILALELGVRFLTDYLDGDRYFATHREGHNLDRCRTQLKLVQDMEEKWEQMQGIISQI